MGKRFLLSVAALALIMTTHASNAQLPDLVDGSAQCSKFKSVDDDTLLPFMRWLAGYRDGVAALAVFDKRLGNLPSDIRVIGVLVLSTCHAKPDRSIGEVANGIIEMLVNRQPGRPLNLAGPKK